MLPVPLIVPLVQVKNCGTVMLSLPVSVASRLSELMLMASPELSVIVPPDAATVLPSVVTSPVSVIAPPVIVVPPETLYVPACETVAPLTMMLPATVMSDVPDKVSFRCNRTVPEAVTEKSPVSDCHRFRPSRTRQRKPSPKPSC